MRSRDEYDRSPPRDAESTARVYFAEEKVHKNCKVQLNSISDLILHNFQGQQQISRTREGPQDYIVDPVNHRRELLLFGRHIELARSITPRFWAVDWRYSRSKEEVSSDEAGVWWEMHLVRRRQPLSGL